MDKRHFYNQRQFFGRLPRGFTLLASNLVAASFVFSGLFCWTGCGDSSIADYQEFDDLYPVTGQIDFKGQAIPGAAVNLYPVGVAVTPTTVPVASGVVDASGRFETFTYRQAGKGRGVAKGEYEVSVSWSRPLPDGGADDVTEGLPAKYVNPKTSGIKITVTEGENTVPPLSLH